MPPFGDLPHHIGVFLGGLADHEEGRMRAVRCQNLQQPWCELWVGSIVKGEGDDGLLCCDMCDSTKYNWSHSPIKPA
jgi:hypothetical protein